MNRKSLAVVAFATLLAGSPAGAQPPAVPPPPTPTLWSFLGIPQGYNKLHGAMFNRRGNFPGLERKLPLRALNDPRNLASDNLAIKKAAEVKIAEDLKKQKIKSIKFLASIGCGCYDIDGSITAAMIAATADCTEEVRLAAVNAIAEAAAGKSCENCGESCCCKEEIVKRLAEMAYERDDKGCCLEPSERVREAAARALEICCPNTSPVIIEAVEPETTPPIPDVEGAPLPGTSPPPLPPVEESVQQGAAPIISSQRQSVARVIPRRPARQEAPLPTPRRTETTQAAAAVVEPMGVVVFADPQRELGHVHFHQQDLRVDVGTRLLVYRAGDNGSQLCGQLEVTEAFAGSANVRPLASTNMIQIRPGDRVVDTPAPIAVRQASAKQPPLPRKLTPGRAVSMQKSL